MSLYLRETNETDTYHVWAEGRRSVDLSSRCIWNFWVPVIPSRNANPCRGTFDVPVTNCSRHARSASSNARRARQNHWIWIKTTMLHNKRNRGSAMVVHLGLFVHAHNTITKYDIKVCHVMSALWWNMSNDIKRVSERVFDYLSSIWLWFLLNLLVRLQSNNTGKITRLIQ